MDITEYVKQAKAKLDEMREEVLKQQAERPDTYLPSYSVESWAEFEKGYRQL